MKHKLLKLIPMWMLTGLLPSAINATDFTYTYEGQTITYTILDESAKTVTTKEGRQAVMNFSAGNEVEGELILPETVYYENEPYTLTKLAACSFFACSRLTKVTIPNTVTSIDKYAFYSCHELTSLTLPNSLTTIGYSAFGECISLTSITLPNSVTTIGNSAFADCRGLTSITIPNSVTTIGMSVFWGCSGLTSIVIPNSVTFIGDNAFYRCSSLEHDVYNDKIFAYATQTIDRTTIEIPDGTETLAGGALCGYSGLTSVTLPNSLKTIGYSAFGDCNGLTSITIPNSVTSIRIFAFRNCSGLTSITIPNSVTTIGDGAFSGCSGLTEVYYGAEEPITGNEDIFDSDTYAGATLNVRESAVAKCREIDPWKNFQNIEAHDFSGIEEVEAGAAANAVEYWNTNGVRSDKPYRGLNLVRYSDGSVRKEIR